MCRQAPRRVRLVHVVLEDEVPRVGPVVRDVLAVVVPHHVGVRRPLRADRVVRVLLAAPPPRVLGDRDEAVHPAAADVYGRVQLAVRAPGVQVVRVVIRLLADALGRIGHAHGEAAVRRPREAVRAGVRAEVVIERTVLLHDHDHVLDLVDRAGGLRGLALRSRRRRRGQSERPHDRRARQGDDEKRPPHDLSFVDLRVLDAAS